MSEVKWIKIITNIFDDEKIQLIESMPDSDSIIVIWFKLLALAGKSNNGGLVLFNEKIPYTNEMLVTLFRRKKTVVDLALLTFEEFGMIEILDNNTILIANWDKHQNIDKLEQIRIGQRERQQKYRDKQKEKVMLALCNSNAIEEEVYKEEKEDTLKDSSSAKKKEVKVAIPFKEIIDYLNLKVSGNYKHTTKQTRKDITTRWNEGFKLIDFQIAIDNTYLFRMENDKGDLTYVRPSTIFNGKFEDRVNGSAFGFKKSNNHNQQKEDELNDKYGSDNE